MAAIATLIYTVIMAAAGSIYIGVLILSGPMLYGYFAYLCQQLDFKEQEFSNLFIGFSSRFVELMIAGILYTLIVTVGTCLLIVPGIIAALGLSMTFLIMLDDPTIKGVDALKASWKMMEMQKWNLFCLYMRYFGWLLLCILTCGILCLWIQPYLYTAQILFYRELRISLGYPPTYKGI